MTPKNNKPGSGNAGSSRPRARSAAIIAQQRAKERRRNLMVQIVVGLMVVGAVFGVTIAALKSNDSSTASTGTPPGLTEDGGVLVGNPDAEVTVSVVEDFQCPHCKSFESEAGSLLESYEEGEEVNVEYRGIAFLNDYSTLALNASACVAENDGTDVWKSFHDALFAQQPPETGPALSTDQVVQIAADAGADGNDVSDCIKRGDFDDWAEQVTNDTLGSDVSGTPTVFVNGEKLESTSAAAIETAVDKALG